MTGIHSQKRQKCRKSCNFPFWLFHFCPFNSHLTSLCNITQRQHSDFLPLHVFPHTGERKKCRWYCFSKIFAKSVFLTRSVCQNTLEISIMDRKKFSSRGLVIVSQDKNWFSKSAQFFLFLQQKRKFKYKHNDSNCTEVLGIMDHPFSMYKKRSKN